MIALLVIDMQVGLFGEETPRHDAEEVVGRINALAQAVRDGGGMVIIVQHDGPPGDPFEPGSDGWALLGSLRVLPGDVVVRKRACDAFYETRLGGVLARHSTRELIITGCATDCCVDTTVRAALSRDYNVVAVADGHTTADRPHADAATVIRHHNWIWGNLLHPTRRIRVQPTREVVADIRRGGDVAP